MIRSTIAFLAVTALITLVFGCTNSERKETETVGFQTGNVATICVETKLNFKTPFPVEMALPNMGETLRLMMYEKAVRRYCGELRLRDDKRNLWIVRLEQDAAFERMTVTYLSPDSMKPTPKTITVEPDDQRVYTFIIGTEVAPLINIRWRREFDPPLLPTYPPSTN